MNRNKLSHNDLVLLIIVRDSLRHSAATSVPGIVQRRAAVSKAVTDLAGQFDAGFADDYVKWVKFPVLAAGFLVPPPLLLPTRYEA